MRKRALACSLLMSCAVTGSAEPELARDAGAADAAPSSGQDAKVGPTPEAGASSVCRALQFPAEPATLELLMLVDRSVSMQQEAKWDDTIAALTAFADAPHASDTRAAVVFAPNPVSGDPDPASGDNCKQDAYRYPLVPMQAIAGFGVPLKEAAQKYGAWGANSPLYPALAGSLDYLTERLSEEPASARAIVLITDGMSKTCDATFTELAALASGGAEQGDPIFTYTIGLDGADPSALAEVAMQGAGLAAAVSADAGVQRQIQTALSAAAAHVLACQLLMPQPEHASIDPNSVRLLLDLDADAGSGEHISQVSADECNQGKAGFRYDHSQAPQRIQLCGASCARVRAAPDAKLRLDVECVWTVE
jgi:hypothetical protein